MTTPLDIARQYIARGWAPVPIAAREKGPTFKDWEELRLTEETAAQRFGSEPKNIGVILGGASGGLVDVDLDCPEAVALAREVFPDACAFGRRSSRRSHLLFVAPCETTKEAFADPRAKETIVEFRANRHQTVFPGSVHPSGEAIEWEPGPDAPDAIDAGVLRAKVVRLAVAVLFQRYAPEGLAAWLATGMPTGLPPDLSAQAAKWLGFAPVAAPAAPAVPRSPRAAARFDEARDAYVRDNARDFGRAGSGQCPACQHNGCFGRLKDSADRWACFSSGHVDGCGVRGEQCTTGDVLDLDAYLAGMRPADFLRAQGYLSSGRAERQDPPPPSDADAPPDFEPYDARADIGYMPAKRDRVPGEDDDRDDPPPTRPGITATYEQPASPRVQASSDAEWPEPEPLDLDLLPVDPLDPNLLPDALRPWLVDCAHRLQAPLDFVAVPAIVGLGSLIGRQVAIRPHERDDWQEIANLWGALIGPPSELKTAAMRAGLSPLDRLAVAANEQHAVEMEKFEKELAGAKARAKALERQIAKAAQIGDSTKDLEALVQPLPKPPIAKRYKTSDATPEKLADMLTENPVGLLLSVDELTGWLYGLERDGHEKERGFFLTGWSGQESHDIDRIGRGSTHLRAVCLSIIGTIQPGPWATYVREALSSKRGADGFLQRFQLAVWPEPLRDTKCVDRYPDHQAKQKAVAIFDALSAIDVKELGAQQGEYDKIPFLRFDQDVQDFARTAFHANRIRWREASDHPALVAHGVKAAKTLAALTLIFHLVDWLAGDSKGEAIQRPAIDRALGWLDYLEKHARRIYGAGTGKDHTAVSLLARKIRDRELASGFAVRDVARRQWAGLSAADSVQEAVEQLVAAAWLRPARVPASGGRGGRPRTVYQVNPAVFDMPSGGLQKRNVNLRLIPIDDWSVSDFRGFRGFRQ